MASYTSTMWRQEVVSQLLQECSSIEVVVQNGCHGLRTCYMRKCVAGAKDGEKTSGQQSSEHSVDVCVWRRLILETFGHGPESTRLIHSILLNRQFCQHERERVAASHMILPAPSIVNTVRREM